MEWCGEPEGDQAGPPVPGGLWLQPPPQNKDHHVQCDAIRWEPFLQRCRLGQL